jgi:polysaccharide biosynthesis protein PslG
VRPVRLAARAALLVAMALAAAASAPASAGAMMDVPQWTGVEIGIADQKPHMFVDERFVALGIRHARLAVGWDVLTNPRSAEELETWLAHAQASGVEPLISFMHSRGANRRALPSPLRMRREFRRLRALYPWVTTYATWNEANHCGEPLCHRPKTAAAYYRVLRRECPTCTILAPEVLDMPGMGQWVRQFTRHLGFTPRLWGLHNYVEANRFKTSRLRELVRVTRGAEIWLTEVGGLVRRDNNSTTEIPEGAHHAGEVTRFIFDDVVPRNPQIARVYIYHWSSSSRRDTWDSALIAPGGRERSALRVLSRVLRFGPRPLGSFRATRAR